MKRTRFKQSTLALATAAFAGLSTASALDTAHAATVSRSATVTSSKTIKGPVEQMQQWGQIRVSLVLTKKKITSVKVSADAHTARSIMIQGGALPILKRETLTAQSARIDTVSGATDTSDAYIQSLQGAIAKARAAKLLR